MRNTHTPNIQFYALYIVCNLTTLPFPHTYPHTLTHAIYRAARHGLKLSGKLQRIDAQDKLPPSEPCSSPDDSSATCCHGNRKRRSDNYCSIDGESAELVSDEGTFSVKLKLTGSKKPKRAELMKKLEVTHKGEEARQKINGVYKQKLANNSVKHRIM